MPTPRTIPVEVYRSSDVGDCTNGGISAAQNRLYLLHEQGFSNAPADDPRILRLVRRSFPWSDQPLLHVEPVNPGPITGKLGPMFGGNFVYSCDSRFPAKYPLPLHDRYETQALYDQLSR